MWNLCLNWLTPFEKHRLRPISAYNLSTVRDSEKCSIIANRKLESTTRFQRAIDEVRTLPLTSRKGGSKSEFVVFLWIKFKFNRIKTATKFICVKTSSGKFIVEPFPYPTVYRCWNFPTSLYASASDSSSLEFVRYTNSVIIIMMLAVNVTLQPNI